MTFILQFLPAKYGDCICIKYGTDENLHHILIDGGTGGTKSAIRAYIQSLPESKRHFELVVVTHVDRDHIEGMLRLLEDDDLGFTVGDFWFNGYQHLSKDEMEAFGAEMGEDLSKRILFHQISWNSAFGGKSVVVPDNGELPRIYLQGGLQLTLLSPYWEHLSSLKPQWINEIRKAGLVPGYGSDPIEDNGIEAFGGLNMPDVDRLNAEPFHEDDSKANGSSIAFIAEFGDQRVLLTGDAFPSTIMRSCLKLFGDGKIPVSLTKLSHHASAHNTSPALLEKLDCPKFIISTNGSIYKHPSKETIAWIIKRSRTPKLYFNYRTELNKIWDNSLLKSQHHYTTDYPPNEMEGIEINLNE